MTDAPLLSYIVLSYNYENYVAVTLQSILAQTVQDFEIIVVDDASSDRSVEVIQSFSDPRIRLHINDRNVGGAASYNRAVEAARGEWLVNLDADDWIAPSKAKRQLDFAQSRPSLDIVGTYVSVINEHGERHSQANSFEEYANRPREFDHVDTWIGSNWLCRSSTMFRRSAHMRIGLDDPDMVRAPDFELWTRALREGCKIAVVPEQLTYTRQHSRGVTHADQLGTLLEISFAMMRNLVPLTETRALHPSFERITQWIINHPALPLLRPSSVYRLLGTLISLPPPDNFGDFQASILANERNLPLERVGQRCLYLTTEGSSVYTATAKMEQDILAFVEARDFWHSQSEAWKGEYERLFSHFENSFFRRYSRKLAQRCKVLTKIKSNKS